jgi:chromosome segregation ATPase
MVVSSQPGGAEYRKGSIIRLTMNNFVTYSAAEIRPGPQLNVVIGPNGTGKSTLVCAMVLGLGGKPASLGRAKEPRDFIKHGEETAIIECELYSGPQSKSNHVIRRKIFSDNSSTWKLNGHESNQKEVLAFVKKLNVQVDNLCQFLPQDRVSAFAAMSPTELLHETQKAINDELEEQHQQLIAMKKEESDLRVNFDAQTKVLADLKTQNDGLRREVARFQERDRLLKQVELLESKRPWVAFEASRTKAVELQKQVAELKVQLQAAEAALQPLEEDFQEKNRKTQEGSAAETQAAHAFRGLTTQRAQVIEKLKAQATKTAGHEARLTNLESTEERRLAQLARAKAKAQGLRKQIADTEVREATRQAQIEQCTARLEELKQAAARETSALQEAQHRLAPLEKELQKLKHMLAEEHKMQAVVMNNLKSDSRASLLLADWVKSEAGRSKLTGAVYGPLCKYMKVTTPLHAAWVATTVPWAHLTGFVTERESDREVLNAFLRQNDLNLTVLYSPHALKDGTIERPLKKKQLQALGLDGYVEQLIDAPPLVKWTLCNASRIHSIGYANDANAALAHVPELQDQARSQKPIRRWVSPNAHYMLIPSYHSANVALTSDPLKNEASLVLPSPLGDKDIADIQNQVGALQAEAEAINREISTAKDALMRVKGDTNVTQQHLKAAHQSDLRSLKMQLTQIEEEIVGLDKDVESERDALKTRIIASVQDRVKTALELRDLTPKWVDASLQSAQLLLKRGFLKNLAVQAEEALSNARMQNNQLRQSAADAERKFLEAKEQTRVLRKEAKKKAERTPELEQAWADLPDTLEALDTEIENHNMRINAISHNPAIMEKFLAREAEIAKLTETLENHGQILQERTDHIEQLKADWLPKIEDFVTKIDQSFSQFFHEIGCIGNVKLSAEGSQFDKFSIDIYVAYRKTDQPRKLDARVQSGGERSVATMLYLIALQHLSDCPFRLVDEINQGMDPHNERMIFDQITAQASKPKTPQYFLITPKLLPDLKFTPAITVLCVFNGPYMTDQSDWNVSANII